MISQHKLTSNSISIYIHWPYCISKCPYCDFNSHKIEEIDIGSWIKAYQNEFTYFNDILDKKYIKSIFFGGGTPSLMPLEIVEAILNLISKIGVIDDNTEITLEANPSSVEQNKFHSIAKLGINRISIGIQSFKSSNLKFLGRAHSADESIKALEIARSHFNRVSFDLIYALPLQSLEDWRNELENASKYLTDHVSLYQLTIEKGTKFYKAYENKEFILPDQLVSEEMYLLTESFLSKRNLKKYEISNYAIEGFESMHNLSYWKYDNYLGIGPGAHSRLSFDNKETYSIMMKSMPSSWLKSNLELGNGIQNSSLLSKQEILNEILMMGLRLKSGIDFTKLKALVGENFFDFFDPKALKMFEAISYLHLDSNLIKLSDKGLLLHNYIVPRLTI